MQLHEMPPSQHIAVVVEATELKEVLANIFGEHPIDFYDTIDGLDCTGRMLSTAPPNTKTATETKKKTPGEVAYAFLLWNSGANRFPSVEGRRAWEVRTATPFNFVSKEPSLNLGELHEDEPRAILWATWSQ